MRTTPGAQLKPLAAATGVPGGRLGAPASCRLCPLGLVLSVILVLWLWPAHPAVGSQQSLDPDVSWLRPGVAVAQDLAAGEVHTYATDLTAGQYLHAIVDQHGVDVVVGLLAPDGRLLTEVDGLSGSWGPEHVSVVAEAAGRYELKIRAPANSGPGSYRVSVEQLRHATREDRERVAAEWIFAQAEQLRRQGGAVALAQALEKLQEALRIWTQLGDASGAADAQHRIGWVYELSGELAKARGQYQQALQILRTLGDNRREARVLNRLGQIYRLSGEVPRALATYQQALAIFRQAGDRRQEGVALSNLGVTYRQLGEIRQALAAFDQARVVWQEIGHQASASGATTLNNLGQAYLSLGKPQRALDYFNQALVIRRELGSRRSEARILSGLGIAYQRLGEWQEALDSIQQALVLRQALGDQRGEAVTLHDLGNAYFKLSRFEPALASCQRALQIFRSRGDRTSEAAALACLGRIYSASGAAHKALEHHRQALALFADLGDPGGQGSALFGMAQAERSRGNLGDARALMEDALDRVETLRTKSANQDLRSSYLASKYDYYEHYVDLLMAMHEREPTAGFDWLALEASERSRARSLLEMLADARFEPRTKVDPDLLARETALQARIDDHQERVSRLKSSGAEDERVVLDRELRQLLEEVHKTQEQIRRDSPRNGALMQPELLSAREMQQQIVDQDTVLLSYFLGEERSFLWLVSPQAITSAVLPGKAVIEAAARQAHELMSISYQRLRRDAASRAAARLSDLILRPVAEQLGTKRLLVVSDGALHYIPFGALPDPRRDNEPLIVSHEIIGVPSVPVLAALERELTRRSRPPKTVAILADPVFEAGDSRVRPDRSPLEEQPPASEPASTAELMRSASDLGLAAFQRLPFSRQEAEAILSLVPEQDRLAALGFSASRERVVGGDLGRYRIVHFATHGVLHASHPELSGIVMSLVDENGRPRDGFLRAHQIRNLDLPVDLVVLSACQTALGPVIKGEGMVGLTHGFMSAGAARVMVSLWRVSDRSTAELMQRFYRKMLEEGLPPAAALRAAQISMWRQERWEAPHAWAGFVLQGAWR